MAKKTDKKTTDAGATASGGGATMTLPEGFSFEKSPFYAEAVARRFDTLPAGAGGPAGTVRLLLVAAKETTDEQVRGLLGNPRFGLRKKAPGIWQADLGARDMEARVAPVVGAGKMFRYVDVGSRLFGATVENETDTATVAVAFEGEEAEAKKKLRSLGLALGPAAAAPADANPEEGEWTDPDEGLITGTIPGGKLSDLVLCPKATAIDVRAVAKK